MEKKILNKEEISSLMYEASTWADYYADECYGEYMKRLVESTLSQSIKLYELTYHDEYDENECNPDFNLVQGDIMAAIISKNFDAVIIEGDICCAVKKGVNTTLFHHVTYLPY